MVTAPLPRSLFDLPDGLVWAMHCAEGPVPRASVAAARAFLEKELRPWELGYDEWLALPARVRAAAARLFGARPGAVTLTSSTSAGLSLVAQGLAWEPGDEVLAPLGEFPSNVWPWKALEAQGVRFREVPLWDGQRSGAEAWGSSPPAVPLDPEARLLEAMGPRTRLMTVSWVRFQDGLRLDLDRLARGCASRGVFFVVDGIQGAGTLPLSLDVGGAGGGSSGVSAFATAVHKGLLAPQGAGLLWTDDAFRARLRPLGSWLSVEGGADFRRASTDFARGWLADARKLEPISPGGVLLVPLAESLAALNAADPARIAAHVSGLQQRLLAALRTGPARASWEAEAERLEALRAAGRLGSILAFHHCGRGPEALQRLMQAGVRQRIYTTIREGYLRVALHGYHDDEDVARLADWLGAPSPPS